jgi:hypothetical protein
MATPTIPAGQEGGLIRVQEAAVTALPRWARGKRRALEVARHGAPTEPDLIGNSIEGPALLMRRPPLVIEGPPSRPPLARQSCCRGGRLGGERPRGGLGGARWTGQIVHWCRVGPALGLALHPCGRAGGEDLSPEVGFCALAIKPSSTMTDECHLIGGWSGPAWEQSAMMPVLVAASRSTAGHEPDC